MRWNAVCVFTFALITYAVGGCSVFGKKNVSAGPAVAADSSMPPVQDTTYGSDPYPTYGPPAPVEKTYDPKNGASWDASYTSIPMTPSEPRYHTVAKSDTLYGLARAYYNDQRRWKDIYEANRSAISDPNRIRIGQRLEIP